MPQLGFGGAPLGNLFTVVSNAEAEATVEAAWAEGLRYLDTSPWYGRGLSEHRIGRCLRAEAARRPAALDQGRPVFWPRRPIRQAFEAQRARTGRTGCSSSTATTTATTG